MEAIFRGSCVPCLFLLAVVSNNMSFAEYIIWHWIIIDYIFDFCGYSMKSIKETCKPHSLTNYEVLHSYHGVIYICMKLNNES